MMKSKDCAVATALVINGFLRSNSEQGLGDALCAIRRECDDWSEGLATGDQAIDPSTMSIELIEKAGGPVARSPENLINAAVELAREAVDLLGPEAVTILVKRLQLPAVVS